MNTVQPNSNFTRVNAGDNLIITYKRDKYSPHLGFGIFLLICLLSALSFLFTDSLSNLGSIGFFTLAIGLSTAAVLGANHSLRKEGMFTVSDTELILDGQLYKKEHIRRLAVVPPKGQAVRSTPVQGSSVIIGGSAIPVAATVLSRQAVNAGAEIFDKIFLVIGNSIRNVNYELTFQYGNKEVKLAGGMSEKNAVYLFDELITILNYRSVN